MSTLPTAAEQALEGFTAAGSWEQRARLLMQWGDALEPLADAERVEANQVQGCESRVWLVGEQAGGHWQFRAASDARLLRGLLAVLLTRVNGLTAEELAAVNVADWFTRLGLARQLSPSRSNGMNAVLLRMHAISQAH